MKFIKNIMLLMAVALFASCDTDVETPQIGSSNEFVAPIIGECSNVVINANNSKEEMVIFTWQAADFGLPVEILYSVYITDGTNKSRIGTSNSTSYSISKGDLNGFVMTDLGIAANETVTVQAYVTAQLAGSSELAELSSNTSNSFTVTTYAAALKKLYAVGFFNGWDVGAAVEIWEETAGTDIYVGMIDLVDDTNTTPGCSGFKIVSARSWNEGNWGYDAFTVGTGITSSDDGNLVLPAGYWKLSVNRKAMSIEATAVEYVDILGSFNGWNDTAGHTPLTYSASENVWISAPIEFAEPGAFLVRLNASWDHKYGSSGVASTAINGGIELVTGGGADIAVAEAGTYIIKLHANRNPYVIEVLKQ